MKISRRDLHVVLVDGAPKKVHANGNIQGLRRGFSQFLKISVDGDTVSVKKFLAGDIREAADAVGSGGSLGIPIGADSHGVVFQIAKVE